MFKKKENGFSLVELAVAAAIATALAVVAVTVVTGTATSVSEKGSSAAAAEECTISESLKGGTDETINDCGTATSGSQSSSVTVTYANNFDAANQNWAWPWSSNETHLTVAGMDAANAQAIIDAINNGATRVTFGSFGATIVPSTQAIGAWPADTIPVDAKVSPLYVDSMYGGYAIAISLQWDDNVQPDGWSFYPSATLHTLTIN